MTDTTLRTLRRVARLYGIKLDYWDLQGRHQFASEASLLGVLRARGCPIDSADDAPRLFAERRRALWERALPPTSVAWEGRRGGLRLRLPERALESTLRLVITLEDGTEKTLYAQGLDLLERPARQVEGQLYAVCAFPLPKDLPLGYHQVTLSRAGAEDATGHLIVAPERCWEPAEDSDAARAWGVFLPLYALRTERSRGAADLGDFARLGEWTARQGGSVVATLPMQAGFLGNGPGGDEPGPYEFSPYSPASRLFLNELFIDLAAVPELADCPEARAILESNDFGDEAAALNAEPLVDYRRQALLQRRVLERLAACFFNEASPGRRARFGEFLDRRPDAEDYARFRAATEHYGASWHTWPEAARAGRLGEGDYDPEVARYHLYCQWVVSEQRDALASHAGEGGKGLYLDMPLGVDSDGYDVWRHRAIFASGAAGGAPPDDFFIKGQNWGFPPIDPERSREAGHAYFVQAVRGMARVAGAVRIDHVMGLHRLYWIPRGLGATEGVYVRYPAEEIYAVLALESRRGGFQVVGENLGTVPAAVNDAMARHGVRGMYVLQFSVQANGDHAIAPVPPGCVASINTHDTPTFAGWWAGADLDLQLELGLIDAAEHALAREYRSHTRDSILYFLRQRGLLAEHAADPYEVHRACLRWLATSPAGLVLISLEDLWLEPAPQNVPGTGKERPNWRRRAALPFEAWTIRDQYVTIVGEVDGLRRRPPEDFHTSA